MRRCSHKCLTRKEDDGEYEDAYFWCTTGAQDQRIFILRRILHSILVSLSATKLSVGT